MDYSHDRDTQEMTNRMESSKLTRRPSKPSTGQNPRRYSARIEKPRSNHQSPRGSERRRTFTAVKQYASLDDHYRKMFGIEDEEVQENVQEHYITTRPVSWHPSSSQCAANDSTTSSTHSLPPVTCQESTTIMNSSVAVYASRVDAAWSSYMHGDPVPHSTNHSYETTPYMHGTSQLEATGHFPQHFSQSASVHYITSKDQDWASESRDEFQREQSTELIGLGLYDPPGTTLPFVHGNGKGLKLEETWQPPEDMEDADADEESEEEEEEPPRPEDARLPQASPSVVNMSGQSFFFEEDDAGVKNEWWYHQYKNPVLQAGTLGYGWI